jgi:hypothetical protein
VTEALEQQRVRASSGGCLRAAALVAALLGLVGWFWWHGYFISDHDVDARVTFTGGAGDALQNLLVVAGPDKASWPTLQAGESVRTTLFTDGGDTTLFVQFVLQGQQVDWYGPDFPVGTGYRIALQVDASGSVTEEHCVLPCQPL